LPAVSISDKDGRYLLSQVRRGPVAFGVAAQILEDLVMREPAWCNRIVKYCLRCRAEHPAGATRCGHCAGPLVPEVVRDKLEQE